MQRPRRPNPTQNPIDADRELDRKLAELVLAGDESAFPQIYDAYYRRVFAFVRKRIGDLAEAEDLTQETFVGCSHSGRETRALVSCSSQRRVVLSSCA